MTLPEPNSDLPTSTVTLIRRRFTYSISIKFLFTRADLIEAGLAARLNAILVDWGKRKGKDLRWVKRVVLAIGLTYYLFSIPLRILLTVILVSLFILLRLIIPLIYIWFTIALGWTIGKNTYDNLTHWLGVDGVALWSNVPGQILSSLPVILITGIIMVIYCAIVIVIALKYRDNVFSVEINT